MTQAKITLDGKTVPMAQDTHILNYGDRTYTPARMVAEALGAKVEWDETSDTVKITSPEPKVIEKVVEKIVEKEVPVASEQSYMKLPVRFATHDYFVDVNGVTTFSKTTELYVSVQNDFDSDSEIYVDYLDAYIVTDNGQVKGTLGNSLWREPVARKTIRQGAMEFGAIDSKDKKIQVVIPIETSNYVTRESEKKEIKFYIDFSD